MRDTKPENSSTGLLYCAKIYISAESERQGSGPWEFNREKCLNLQEIGEKLANLIRTLSERGLPKKKPDMQTVAL